MISDRNNGSVRVAVAQAAHKGVFVIYDEVKVARALAGVIVNVDKPKLCNVIRNLVGHGIDRTPIGANLDVICFIKSREEKSARFSLSSEAAVHPRDDQHVLVTSDADKCDCVRIEVHDKGYGLVEVMCRICCCASDVQHIAMMDICILTCLLLDCFLLAYLLVCVRTTGAIYLVTM